MKVKEFIEQLQKLPQDLEVIMSKDAEGNNFSPFSDCSDDVFYVADSTWSGELWREEDAEDWDKPDNAVPCVVLWPAN